MQNFLTTWSLQILQEFSKRQFIQNKNYRPVSMFPVILIFWKINVKTVYPYQCFFCFFFLCGFSFTNTHKSQNHRTAEVGGGHFFNPSLPLPPASQRLRHYPGDYCRKLTSAHSQQSDSNQEPLVSERKSLSTKLRAPMWR